MPDRRRLGSLGGTAALTTGFVATQASAQLVTGESGRQRCDPRLDQLNGCVSKPNRGTGLLDGLRGKQPAMIATAASAGHVVLIVAVCVFVAVVLVPLRLYTMRRNRQRLRGDGRH